MKSDLPPQGAELSADAVQYRIWAPDKQKVEVEIFNSGGGIVRRVPLTLDAMGYHHGSDSKGASGDCYKYRLEERDSFPDPFSRWQPAGVHGPSMVIDHNHFDWSDGDWRCPPFRELIIYELHIGTFTHEGTFRAAIEKLPYLRDLGINAIELMPIADFPGDKNWGYDGVMIYAPARAYGHPDDLRALVNAAHQHEIAVILDVVYNHFGPDGNYLGSFSPFYFSSKHKTPWGDSINFDGDNCAPVRAMFVANPLYWMEEFHIDGFRCDATHAIVDDSPRHILEEITDVVHSRGGFAIAEDSRNEARLGLPPHDNGLGFDAIWADDFHHITRVGLTKEREGYLEDFRGDLNELVDVLKNGWLYRGRYSRHSKAKRGSECLHLLPQKFVHCISNHDQVGNRAFGERLSQLVPAPQYRAASALLCLTPYTPMLFMGQEFSASTPFQFFTDHNLELGKLITQGRRKEFKDFAAFNDPAMIEKIPDPQATKTFEDSKLRWSETDEEEHAQMLALYRAFLALRRREAAFRPTGRQSWQVEALSFGVGALRSKGADRDWLVLFDFEAGHDGALEGEWSCEPRRGHQWRLVLSSNEERFGGTGETAFEKWEFNVPETLVLAS